MKAVQKRLDGMRVVEHKLQGPIQGIDLEHQLDYVAKVARTGRKNLFHGAATGIDHQLGPDQQRFVYALLNKIVETRRIPPITLDEINSLIQR